MKIKLIDHSIIQDRYFESAGYPPPSFTHEVTILKAENLDTLFNLYVIYMDNLAITEAHWK